MRRQVDIRRGRDWKGPPSGRTRTKQAPQERTSGAQRVPGVQTAGASEES
ncbi:hypothetical protein [Halogeometricum luteum]|nr:hypothetical protein [Halogeometricum sp. S3BR5-2]